MKFLALALMMSSFSVFAQKTALTQKDALYALNVVAATSSYVGRSMIQKVTASVTFVNVCEAARMSDVSFTVLALKDTQVILAAKDKSGTCPSIYDPYTKDFTFPVLAARPDGNGNLPPMYVNGVKVVTVLDPIRH